LADFPECFIGLLRGINGEILAHKKSEGLAGKTSDRQIVSAARNFVTMTIFDIFTVNYFSDSLLSLKNSQFISAIVLY